MTTKFINLSCVKFGNIKFDSLEKWKENSIKNGLDEKIAEFSKELQRYNRFMGTDDLPIIGLVPYSNNIPRCSAEH
jgi:hypothetical protein